MEKHTKRRTCSYEVGKRTSKAGGVRPKIVIMSSLKGRRTQKEMIC